MMLYPAMSELLKQVPSRYQLVNVVAARARKIAARAEREGLMLEEKPVSIAVQEIADGKLDEPWRRSCRRKAFCRAALPMSRRTPPATSSPITRPPWKPRLQSLPLRKPRRSWRAAAPAEEPAPATEDAEKPAE